MSANLVLIFDFRPLWFFLSDVDVTYLNLPQRERARERGKTDYLEHKPTGPARLAPLLTRASPPRSKTVLPFPPFLPGFHSFSCRAWRTNCERDRTLAACCELNGTELSTRCVWGFISLLLRVRGKKCVCEREREKAGEAVVHLFRCCRVWVLDDFRLPRTDSCRFLQLRVGARDERAGSPPWWWWLFVGDWKRTPTGTCTPAVATQKTTSFFFKWRAGLCSSPARRACPIS